MLIKLADKHNKGTVIVIYDDGSDDILDVIVCPNIVLDEGDIQQLVKQACQQNDTSIHDVTWDTAEREEYYVAVEEPVPHKGPYQRGA
jgi:hypothetical protein